MPPTPHRRRTRTAAAMVVGAATVAGAAACGLAIAASASPLGGTPITGQPLVDPPVLASRDGLLATALEARTSVTHIAGRRVVSGVYNGLYPGPTLQVRPGDRLRVADVNRLAGEPTNLHVHGMHVSPAGHGDNVFVNLPTGHTFVNDYLIPRDQLPGLYWYHPHRHMYVESQVYGGMAGAIVVRGSVDELPGIAGRRERVMVMTRTEVGSNGRVVPVDRAPSASLRTYINGQLRPVMHIRPGEVQRWRILNAQADDFLRLALDNHTFWMVGSDGSPETRPVPVTTMLIPPGGRREVLVRGGAAGTSPLRTLAWGSGFQKVKPTVLATVKTDGARITGQRLPGHLYDLPDLRRATVARHRRVEFSMLARASGPPEFRINGKTYHQVQNTDIFTMKRGTVEEWTLTNVTDEYHPFHIHVNPFQVIAINGVPVKGIDYRDTVPIPPGGSVTIRTRLTDFTGRFVIHCHILFHEDHGMMAPVRVVA